MELQEAIDYASVAGHSPNAPLRGQKTGVYEGGVRVPLIARWPDHVPAGTQDNSLIALTDMLATFAEFFDHSLSAGCAEDSMSFLTSLMGTEGSASRRNWHLVLWSSENSDLCEYPRWLTNTHTQRWHLIHSAMNSSARMPK